MLKIDQLVTDKRTCIKIFTVEGSGRKAKVLFPVYFLCLFPLVSGSLLTGGFFLFCVKD